jgi:hypothetical protein
VQVKHRIGKRPESDPDEGQHTGEDGRLAAPFGEETAWLKPRLNHLQLLVDPLEGATEKGYVEVLELAANASGVDRDESRAIRRPGLALFTLRRPADPLLGVIPGRDGRFTQEP